MRLKIRCDRECEKFCKTFWEVNKALEVTRPDFEDGGNTTVHACPWHMQHVVFAVRDTRFEPQRAAAERWRLHARAERFPLDIVHCTVQILRYSSTFFFERRYSSTAGVVVVQHCTHWIRHVGRGGSESQASHPAGIPPARLLPRPRVLCVLKFFILVTLTPFQIKYQF